MSQALQDRQPVRMPGPAFVGRTCARCLMDESDPDIRFDASGQCSHCLRFDRVVVPQIKARKDPEALAANLERIKAAGAGKPYDCVVGLSGGVDSSYAIWVAVDLGLRPLVVHLDNGWNAELAVANIERILKKLDLDLVTVVLDWPSFSDLQLAFLKASTPDSEIPSDHAIFASLYQVAARFGIKYILTGENLATEGVRVPAWSQGQSDWRYIKAIHSRFGTVPLKAFPHLSAARFAYYTLGRKIKVLNVLDFVEYNKKAAVAFLQREMDWQAYKGKHGESVYTRFYQGYILPSKFGYDKRKVHLSTLIWSGQLTRDEALEAFSRPDYDARTAELDFTFVAKKFRLTEAELGAILAQPPRRFEEFPSYARVFHRLPWLERLARRIRRL